jgi:hypothetical protein
MEMISESYRGLGLVVEVIADRVLVPFAVVVALLGAAIIGVELREMFAPSADIHRQL